MTRTKFALVLDQNITSSNFEIFVHYLKVLEIHEGDSPNEVRGALGPCRFRDTDHISMFKNLIGGKLMF